MNLIDYKNSYELGFSLNTALKNIPYKDLFNDLNSRMTNLSFYTFKVFGWIGDYEPLHLNGIITNMDIESRLVKDNIKLPNFKKVKS